MADASIPINVWLDRPEQIAPDAFAAGYAAALDEARKAVDTGLIKGNSGWTATEQQAYRIGILSERGRAIAAIDALKGEQA